MWRTWRRNIACIVTDIIEGIKNVIRWTPIIWYDVDYDCGSLCRIMEYKLRRMGRYFNEDGHLVNSHLNARRCLVCAELLRRINEDDLWHWQNAKVRFGDGEIAAKFSVQHERADQAYLGLLLGKYLRHWWD